MENFIKNTDVDEYGGELTEETEYKELYHVYKKAYNDMLKQLGRCHSELTMRCPFVKSCCGACTLLKTKLKDMKNYHPKKQNGQNK